MKVVVRAVLWKAEAMVEMKRSRNSGVGVEVVVVGGRERAEVGEEVDIVRAVEVLEKAARTVNGCCYC